MWLYQHSTALAISALLRDDLDTIQTIAQRPQFTNIRDENGNNLLQMSISLKREVIFGYFLSLKRFDLESVNFNGETALMLSMHHLDSHFFALELIKNGASVHSVRYFNNTILHFALFKRSIELAEVAIQKGVDVNAVNDTGCTALHMLLQDKSDPENINNGVALMLCNDADLTIADYHGFTPFDLAILCGTEVATALESLFYYSFDTFTKRDMEAEIFFNLIELGPKWFPEIVDKVTVVFGPHVICHTSLLFAIDPEILRTTVEYFDYVVRELLRSREPFCRCCNVLKRNAIENFEILLHSALRDETLSCISGINISLLINELDDEVPADVATDLVFYLLSYGAQVFEYDLEVVYKTYGFCDLFKTMLYMDVKKDKKSRIDIMPKIIFDVNMEVKEFIGQYYTQGGLAEMLCYFSLPELRNLCYWSCKELTERVTSLPNVPLLIELARDAARKFLLKKFKVTKASEFFTLLKKLPITRTHEAILTYETKLY